MRSRILFLLVMFFLACPFLAAGPVSGGEPVTLAAGSTARFPVVVAPEAGERTRQAAADLATYLGRISGAGFAVEEGDGLRGIAVGVFRDFPALGLAGRFDPEDLTRRDEYLLRTHAHGVQLVGATEMAAQHATWDFLQRLGYRLYFPTDTWEIVPAAATLRIALNAFERPDYHNRLGPRGGPWTDGAHWRRWRDRNRISSSFSVSTGHVYGRIISRNRAAFDENPEFFALRDGERRVSGGDRKFCIANPGLRALVVADAIDRTGPDTDSISMDPSDGGNWCECDDCLEMGSVSDRVVILSNEVAAAINELGLGDKYVGIYAYHEHSPPPAVDVHPKVIVSIATSFIRGGYTLEELVDGWSARAQMIGIRDYHDVHTWSRALPRSARGGNIGYLVERIPWFHERGARFMNSEASDSWGANGLGYWLSARLLWDVSAAERVDGYIEEFLANCFGAAREPMREFYRLLNLDRSPRSREDLLGRLYRRLAEARALSDDPAVHARLEELALYVRYMELVFLYDEAGGAREEAAQALLRHAYRMRDTMLVPIQSVYRNLRRRGVAVPGEANPGNHRLGAAGRDVPPWLSSESFAAAEIDGFIAAGIEAYQPTVLDFEPVEYSDDLVPAAARLGLPDVSGGHFGTANRFRGRHTVFTWLDPERREVSLEVTGGFIYRNRGNIRLALHAAAEAVLEPVAVDESVPPDREMRPVVLRSPHAGLHWLEWSDGGARTVVNLPADQPLTFRSSLDEPARPEGRWDLFFYVPRGTTVVGGYSTGTRGLMHDGEGNTVFNFAEMGGAGYFSVPVPAGRDGQLWRFVDTSGQRRLMTVPPYLARSAAELLLPEEVVARDGQRE